MPITCDLEQFYREKAVLVTGGAGFIGSHLVDRLVALGARITVLDDFSTGSLQNIAKHLTKIKLIIGDITSVKDCAMACAQQQIIFHTAALTAIGACQTNPEICNKINVKGTENLLQHCAANSVFVLSSSAAVYGNSTAACQEQQLLTPLSVYGTSKLQAEQLAAAYAAKTNFKALALRYFNVYGSRQNSCPNPSVITAFKRQISQQLPITIFGDGQQQRDFISVLQVVDANIKSALLATKTFDSFNIASGNSICLQELLNRLSCQLKLPLPEITYRPARTADICKSIADCSKYQRLIANVSFIGDYNESTDLASDFCTDCARNSACEQHNTCYHFEKVLY